MNGLGRLLKRYSLRSPRASIGRRWWIVILLLPCLAGCKSTMDKQVNVSSKLTLTGEQIVYWAGVAAVAYAVIDPAAPNWEIQEAKFPEDRYLLTLKMKRYYTGGAGEARVVFQRRARELMQKGGFSEFQILEYREGLDSSAIGSQRTAEGVIAMVKK